MRRKFLLTIFFVTGFMLRSDAQITEIISVIKAAVTKVIKAVDLEVQRLQTQTIWLQDAQKQLENTMSELKLNEITNWVQKQKDLYDEYYTELKTVKDIIAGYDKVKKIAETEARVASSYQTAFHLFKADKHFSADELSYMEGIYSGILDESLNNAGQVLLVVNSFVTEMSDAERMAIIDRTAKAIEKNYNDIKSFNNQNMILSIQRSADEADLNSVKKLYGLP